MSFSLDVKNELARVKPAKKCCMLAEIAGFTRMCGTVSLVGGGKMKLILTTENAAVARHYKSLIKDYFDVDATAAVGSNVSSLKKGKVYTLTLDDREDQKAEPVLRETGILLIREGMNYISDGIYSSIIRSKCCRKSYLRGLFLGSGTMTDPKKAYQLEYICNTEILAGDVRKLINTFTDLSPKIIARGKSHIVYIQEAEQVGDMLNLMGAHNQFFVLEDIRMMKNARGMANRIANCDNANMDKTLNAAEKQIAAIRKIESAKGLGSLPSKLREAAETRLAHPDISLQELADMMDPPLKKSGLNHRLQKIIEIAEKL